MKLLTVLFVPQMLQHIRLNALPAGSRLQCILGLLAVLWHQDKRCFSPTGDRPQQPGCQGVGDMLSHLLAVLLDASVGTSVFCCLPPRVLLQCLRTMVTQVVPHCLAPDHSCQLCILLFGHVSWVCFERVLFLFKTRLTSCPGGPCTLFRSSVLAVYIYLFFKAVSILYCNSLSCVCFPLDMSTVYASLWAHNTCNIGHTTPATCNTGHLNPTPATVALYASL